MTTVKGYGGKFMRFRPAKKAKSVPPTQAQIVRAYLETMNAEREARIAAKKEKSHD